MFVLLVPGQPRVSVDGWVAMLASRYVADFPYAPAVSGQLASLEPSRPKPMVKIWIPAAFAFVAAIAAFEASIRCSTRCHGRVRLAVRLQDDPLADPGPAVVGEFIGGRIDWVGEVRASARIRVAGDRGGDLQ